MAAKKAKKSPSRAAKGAGTKAKPKPAAKMQKPKPKAASKPKSKTAPKPKPKPKPKAKPKPASKPASKQGATGRPAKSPPKKPKGVSTKKGKPAATPDSPAVRNLSLKKELLRHREEIINEAKREISKYIKGESRQLVETALDDGDWSVVDLAEDINLRQLSIHRDTLRKIDEAIRKLAEGTYGICEECGEPISVERLKVLPFAIYCRDDQEKKEIMEAIEREGF